MAIFAPEVEFVGGAYFGGDGDGEAVTFDGLFGGVEVDADFVEGEDDGAGGGACYDDLIARVQLPGFHVELGNADVGEVAHTFGAVFLDAGGRRAVFGRPFAEALAEVISVPEPRLKILPSCSSHRAIFSSV